jgi:hypothetical protein
LTFLRAVVAELMARPSCRLSVCWGAYTTPGDGDATEQAWKKLRC